MWIAGVLVGVTTIGTIVAAYITHLVTALSYLLNPEGVTEMGYAVILIIGTIIPPIGIVHGVMVWMGIV